MIRTIITPQQQNISLNLPQEYVGKKVEVIAFTTEEDTATNTDLLEQFQNLAAQWKKQTGLYSTTAQKVYNNVYLDIIGLGREIVPLILQDMANEGSAHWHTALKALTHQNPVPDNDLSKSKIVKQAWLQWGRENHII